MTTESTTPYDATFFDYVAEEGRRSAEVIVPIVVDMLHPHSVVDVGCGRGAWLSVFTPDVARCVGLDGAYVTSLLVPDAHFIRTDLSRPVDLDERFDLAVSLEVAEHLPPARAASFVADLTRLAPAVLFGAAIPGQGGEHHVNEQWPDYWAALFSVHGMRAHDVIRPVVWADPAVAWFYAQNTVLYMHESHPLAGAGTGTPARLVHPELFTRVARGELGVRRAVGPLGRAVWTAARRRIGRAG